MARVYAADLDNGTATYPVYNATTKDGARTFYCWEEDGFYETDYNCDPGTHLQNGSPRGSFEGAVEGPFKNA